MPVHTLYQAMYTRDGSERPLPSLPSPTLTNPDMVLPDFGNHDDYFTVPSPPRKLWEHIQSGSEYQRRASSEHGSVDRASAGSSSTATVTQQRDKRGLMSRKMLLLRSRTDSESQKVQSARVVEVASGTVQSRREHAFSTPYTDLHLQNLASSSPNQLDADDKSRSSLGSAYDSDESDDRPAFLAQYGQTEIAIEENAECDDQTVQSSVYAESISESVIERRQQQAEDEQTSLLLSRRAELILADAKKRLNLMEGNLRGARELVAPLTAANLKRAASLGSNSIYRNSYGDISMRDSGIEGEPRMLHSQASSPIIGRDYHSGHWRGLSANELPERPLTSLEHSHKAPRRIPIRINPSYVSNHLRNSRSHDSLSLGYRPPSRTPFYMRGSPDPTLGRLDEHDPELDFGFSNNVTPSESGFSERSEHRAPSRTDDLREQMSSLKGRISTLRQRAQQDSLRRRSFQTLREPSPLNNATVAAPELYYNPPLVQEQIPKPLAKPEDQNALGIYTKAPSEDKNSSEASWNAAENKETVSEPTPSLPALQEDHRRAVSVAERSHYQPFNWTNSRHEQDLPTVEPHKQQHSGDWASREMDEQPPRAESPKSHSQASASFYEDARDHQIVAHEDREDAFDYENFFLHSRMRMSGTFYPATEDSSSSSGDSVTSASTAKGPFADDREPGFQWYDDEDESDGEVEDEDEPDTESNTETYDPSLSLSGPETPEQLRQIERELLYHRRVLSTESVSTMATFATANEGIDETSRQLPRPIVLTHQDRPLTPGGTISKRASTAPLRNYSRPTSRASITRPASQAAIYSHNRPVTALPITQKPALSDSSSERADSGVGIPPNQQLDKSTATGVKRAEIKTLHPRSVSVSAVQGTLPLANKLSPPMSPGTFTFPQDPATVIVNALLDPTGRALGLKDKAMLYGVVESLRRTVLALQHDDDRTSYPIRLARQKLEDAKKMMEGTDVLS